MTKGSDLFPKVIPSVGDVTQAELDQASSDLKEMIFQLQTGLDELESREPDVTEAELKKAIDDAHKMIKAVEDSVAELKAKAPDVTKAVFDQAVEDLETSIAALPTSAQLDAVKTDVIAVQDKMKALETDKADKSAVEAANKAINDVGAALKSLAALPPDVSQKELDDAISTFDKKVKSADDAISAANQSIANITPLGAGKTLDLNSIKVTGSGFWNGAALTGGPYNAGSSGSGCWTYTGDATTGTQSIVVWTAPDLRLAEGSWIRARTAGTWGEWLAAPKATDFQITKGATEAVTGQNWAIALGHQVTLSYVDVDKTIKLKPHNTTWDKVTQYNSIGGFTVPAKPASGSAVVELKYDPAKGEWKAVVTADPLDIRMIAVEAKTATNETAINGIDARLKKLEGLTYDIQEYALDGGNLFTFSEAAGLYDLVHLKLDGTAELANDKDQNKPADGIVIAPVASGGKAKIFGNGSRLADIGLTGVNQGTIVYTGTSGDSSLSSTGSARLIQPVAVFRNGFYWYSFDDKGYWIA